MKQEWLIIPDFENIQESLDLAQEYNAAFEYNDFFEPSVYSDEKEVKRRVSVYKRYIRRTGKDTLHGVFLGIEAASQEPFIRDYSRKRMIQSMEIARELGVKGVVFHSGLISGLKQKSYFDFWYRLQEEWIRHLLEAYPELNIYMENTLESRPEELVELKRRLADCDRFQLCLDYGHACLSATAPEEWCAATAGCLGHIHLNDNDLKEDLHMVPGDGAIDFAHFQKLQKQYKINVPILLEVKGTENQRRALEFMCRQSVREGEDS